MDGDTITALAGEVLPLSHDDDCHVRLLSCKLMGALIDESSKHLIRAATRHPAALVEGRALLATSNEQILAALRQRASAETEGRFIVRCAATQALGLHRS
jgi:hypothetical protein